jgi:hypothetical protein
MIKLMNRKINRNKYLLLPIALCLIAGCNKEDAWDIVKTRGEHFVEERAVSAFHAITIKNGINVVLTHGDSYTATVEGWKNLMPKIRLIVEKGGELVIEDVNKYSFMRNRNNMSTVYLTIADELNNIYFSGDGYFVTNDTIAASGLTVVSDGSGSVDIKVKAEWVHVGSTNKNIASITVRGLGYSVGVTNWGYSPIDLSDFKVSYAGVAQRGPGNTYINASESIDVTFYSGTGDVHYAGNPSSITFTREDKGKGNLYKIDN